jgi:hypothetical protein
MAYVTDEGVRDIFADELLRIDRLGPAVVRLTFATLIHALTQPEDGSNADERRVVCRLIVAADRLPQIARQLLAEPVVEPPPGKPPANGVH